MLFTISLLQFPRIPVAGWLCASKAPITPGSWEN